MSERQGLGRRAEKQRARGVSDKPGGRKRSLLFSRLDCWARAWEPLPMSGFIMTSASCTRPFMGSVRNHPNLYPETPACRYAQRGGEDDVVSTL
jgi:hypothetical protein